MGKTKLDYESPYPLKRQYFNRVLPSFFVLAIVICTIVAYGSEYLIHRIYLQLSANRAETIDRALSEFNDELWIDLQNSDFPLTIYSSSEGQGLLSEIRNEVSELGLSQLKIYGKEGLLLYDSNESNIGTNDSSFGYISALGGHNNLVEKKYANGTHLYELYVLVPRNKYRIVMELYEPIDYLNSITYRVLFPSVLIIIILLISLVFIIGRLVYQAQADINYRTGLLRSFSQRLAKLVSDNAARELKAPDTAKNIPSKRVMVTILFTDIRGFTQYCERSDPQTIVSFLNESLGIVIKAIKKYDGDVDKIIGDAVLAFFVGENAEVNALSAAEQCIRSMKLKPGIGIGIYSGEVISGVVGGDQRMDFTIIGDSVNVASRLCSLAEERQIVVDTNTFVKANQEVEAASENVKVKGRAQSISIHRIKF